MKYRKLKNSTDIMQLLQFATNAVLKEEITESMAKTLTYIASISNQVIKTHELEKRLDEIENKLTEVEK